MFWSRDNSSRVSIPHRYGKNYNLEFYLYYENYGFPFLIGTVRTQISIKVNIGYYQVSIPHRYGKNDVGELKDGMNKLCFHSS